MLEQVEITQVIQYDEWRWKVSYGMPAHGKDFWGKKAEEREKKEGSVKSRRKRFSFRRRDRDREKERREVATDAGAPPKTPSTPVGATRRH